MTDSNIEKVNFEKISLYAYQEYNKSIEENLRNLLYHRASLARQINRGENPNFDEIHIGMIEHINDSIKKLLGL